MPHKVIACTWRERGLISSISACPSGMMNAPNPPCTSRATTITGSDQASAHTTEAMVNTVTDHSSRARRPILSVSHPVTGVAIAEATI